jgi:hypothetical protein
MGGKSSSSASNKTSTTNQTKNESLNAAISGDLAEDSIAASGKNVTITQVDPNSLDFLSGALDGVGGVITQLLENQSKTYNSATDLAGLAVSNITKASGVEPIGLLGKPLTQLQKFGLGVGGFVSVGALAYVINRDN